MTNLPTNTNEELTAWNLAPCVVNTDDLESWLLLHGHKFANRIYIERNPIIKYGFFEEFKVYLNDFYIGDIISETLSSFCSICHVYDTLNDLTVNYKHRF